jgi:hypothetical protein
MTYLNNIFFVLCPPYKMHFCGILTTLQTSYPQTPLQKKVDFDDKGAFNMFKKLMHSWVGYELVEVLLNFGLSPKIWQDLEDWSPDSFNLFSYLGNKQRDPSKKQAEHLLTILFDRTLHNGYFAKLTFGRRDKFAKMTNITLPLVVLRWLCQLQEYFYKIGDTNENRDWNTHGKYVPVKARHVTRDSLWTTCT